MDERSTEVIRGVIRGQPPNGKYYSVLRRRSIFQKKKGHLLMSHAMERSRRLKPGASPLQRKILS